MLSGTCCEDQVRGISPVLVINLLQFFLYLVLVRILVQVLLGSKEEKNVKVKLEDSCKSVHFCTYLRRAIRFHFYLGFSAQKTKRN